MGVISIDFESTNRRGRILEPCDQRIRGAQNFYET